MDADADSTAGVLETITVSDDGGGDLAPDATSGAAGGTAADTSNDEATPGPRVAESSEPPAKGQRAPLQDVLNGQESQQAARPTGRFPPMMLRYPTAPWMVLQSSWSLPRSTS